MIKTPKRKIKIPIRTKDRPMIPASSVIRPPNYDPFPQKHKKKRKRNEQSQ